MAITLLYYIEYFIIKIFNNIFITTNGFCNHKYTTNVYIQVSRIKSKRVRISYSLGSDIARMTFFKVGYRINMTDRWKAKKNG